MARAAIRMIVPAAVLAVVVMGCGSAGNVDSPGSPTPTMTVPGDPSARVTDVAAYGLTQKQLNTIISACKQGVGIPGTTGSRCQNLGAAPIAVIGRLIYLRALQPCLPQSISCVLVGRITGSGQGIVQVRNPAPGGPRCGQGEAVLCAGAVVPVAVVAPLIGTSSSTPSPSVSTSPSAAPVPSVSPSTVITTSPPPSAAPSQS
jgi:hypothetical protein